MSNEIHAIPIRGIPNADSDAAGTAVLFQMESEAGQRQTYAIPIDRLVPFIATLTAAAQKAEEQRGEGGEPKVGERLFYRAMANPMTTVGFEPGAVLFCLYPKKHLPLRIALSPGNSRKLSGQLLDAATKAEERPGRPT